jgi:hypothetical protein
VHVPEATLAAIKQEAERRGVTVSQLAEQAWRIAEARVRAATRIDELVTPGPAGPFRGSAKVQQTLMLTPASEHELQRQAARLDATVSQVFLGAWNIAYDVLRRTSSLLS